MTLQHCKKCNIRSLWGYLPSFIYIFWLLWDPPSAHAAAAHWCFISVVNIQSSFPVARCLLLPVDGAAPLDPAASCCHRLLTRNLERLAAQQPFDMTGPALCVCSAVHSAFLLELSGCLHWLESLTLTPNASAAPPWVSEWASEWMSECWRCTEDARTFVLAFVLM